MFHPSNRTTAKHRAKSAAQHKQEVTPIQPGSHVYGARITANKTSKSDFTQPIHHLFFFGMSVKRIYGFQREATASSHSGGHLSAMTADTPAGDPAAATITGHGGNSHRGGGGVALPPLTAYEVEYYNAIYYYY